MASQPQPDTIWRLRTALYPSFALLAAIQLDVFTPLGVCPTILEERRHQSQASLVGTQWIHFGLGAPVGSAVWVKNRLRSPVLGACLAYPAVARLVRHSFRIL